jgi:hypothetical protein
VKVLERLNKCFAKQIKVVFKKELRADQIRRMLAPIPFRLFCLPFCFPKKVWIKIYRTLTSCYFMKCGTETQMTVIVIIISE